MRNDPSITRELMAKELGITSDGVKYHIKKLRDAGIIEHIDGDKGGYWKINMDS